jgi:hypothetical protein
MIALERIWTVAGRLDVGWGAADWLMFAAVVMLPPFAMMGASLLLPLAHRSVITDCEETGNV